MPKGRVRPWIGRVLTLALLGAPVLSPAPAGATTSQPITGSMQTMLASVPPIPKVAPPIVDGKDPTALLAQAIALSSAGERAAPLQAALDAASRQLDTDSVAASQADAAAAAAAAGAAQAQQAAMDAERQVRDLQGPIAEAAIRLYIGGPAVVPHLSSMQEQADGAVFADTILSPGGLLAERREESRAAAASFAQQDHLRASAAASAAAADALRAESQSADQRVSAALDALDTTNAALMAAERKEVAAQAAANLTSPTALDFTPSSPLPPPVATTPVALAWVFSELGKPYTCGATGPNTFYCSGLTQFTWAQAGVAIPRVAADQDAWTVPVPLSQLLPGDLVFYGTTLIHHVGMYIGDGLMINAPHTGDVVRVSPIWYSDLAGFGRVHAPGTPVPERPPLSAPVVVSQPGPVPSQTKPPAGWTPKPGGSAPLPGYYPSTSAPGGPSGTPSSTAPAVTTGTTVPPQTTPPTTRPPPTTTRPPQESAPTSTSTTTTSLPPRPSPGGTAVRAVP